MSDPNTTEQQSDDGLETLEQAIEQANEEAGEPDADDDGDDLPAADDDGAAPCCA